MESSKKQKFKESFGNYLKSSNEVKDCKDPCIKNGRSDIYCFECSNEMMSPIIDKIKS